MTADEMRETLARTLGEAWITSGPRAWDEQSEARRQGARHLADAILPTVRHIAADELRAAADWAATSAIDIRAVCEHLHTRADALDPATDGKEPA